MELKTKYSLNETVYYIHKTVDRVRNPCAMCLGERWLTANSIRHTCPHCNGRGYEDITNGESFKVSEPLTIGRISVKVTSIKPTGMFENVGVYNPDNIKYETSYMCYETGIGSGNVYYEDKLFSSKEEAEKKLREDIL